MMNLDETVEFIQKCGCIGETLPLKCFLVVCSGKLCINKKGTSLNLHADDRAGIGKDHVISSVKGLVYTKSWMHRISPSKTAITYLCNDTPNALKDKILYIEDPGEDFLNSDDCKMLLTEEINTSRTINFKATEIKSDKPVVIISTAAMGKNHQVTQRLPSIKFDSSDEQTDEITKHQLDEDCFERVTTKITVEEQQKVILHFNSLKKYRVDISKIRDLLEEERRKDKSPKMRRLFPRLRDYVKFCAVFHQKHRETKKSDSPVEFSMLYAIEEDYHYGKEVFDYMYTSESSDKINVLSPRQRAILEKMQSICELKTITQIQAWAESEDATWQTIQSDLRKIAQIYPEEITVTNKYPAMYGWGIFDEEDEEN